MKLRHLLIERNVWLTQDSILKKQRHHFVDKVNIVKTMVFPVVMYRYESWTIKKSESWRINAFELWFWRTLLRVPWTARSNQLILKEINPEYSLEDWCWSWSSNTLATWYEELSHWGKKKKKQQKANPDAGKDWGQEEKGVTEDEMGGWHCQLNGHEFEQTLGDSELQLCLMYS